MNNLFKFPKYKIELSSRPVNTEDLVNQVINILSKEGKECESVNDKTTPTVKVDGINYSITAKNITGAMIGMVEAQLYEVK